MAVRRTRIGAIVLVLAGLQLLPLSAVDAAIAESTPMPADYCRPAIEHAPMEVGTEYAFPPNGRDLRGTFPPPTRGQSEGSDFGVLNLDGTMVVAFQGIVVHPTHLPVRRYFGFAHPDAATIATVRAFFQRLNECAPGATSADASGLFSDFGYSWVCYPDDIFRLDETGLTSMCPDGDSGESVRRADFLLDIYVLDDGRLVCVTSLESRGAETPATDTVNLKSIIWVISYQGEDMQVDAAIGGIDWETSLSSPISVMRIGSTPS